MIKMLVTKAVISQGFDGAAALRYTENSETPSVRFRIGMPVYDKRAEKGHRFVNITVKAFGHLAERIRRMDLNQGSYVNIIGRYDEEKWEDQTTREKKSAPVLIAEEIEYGTNGGGGRQSGDGNGASSAGRQRQPAYVPPGGGQPPVNFSGYESFGGVNPYFPEN